MRCVDVFDIPSVTIYLDTNTDTSSILAINRYTIRRFADIYIAKTATKVNRFDQQFGNENKS